MKATGEVMAISKSFEGALMKAIRSLELNIHAEQPFCTHMDGRELTESCTSSTTSASSSSQEAIRRGMPLEEIHAITMIDDWFLQRIQRLVRWNSGSRPESGRAGCRAHAPHRVEWASQTASS